MRTLHLLALASLSACASSTVHTGAREAETVRIAGSQGGQLRVTSNAQASVTRIAFPMGKVWHALPAAFENLGIPITAVDTGTHTISNGGLKFRRVLGSAPLGRYIDCGSTQVGESADSYDVYLTVVSQVEEDPATGLAVLHTIFESMARPIVFSREYSRCSSRGELERRLATAVTDQLMR